MSPDCFVVALRQSAPRELNKRYCLNKPRRRRRRIIGGIITSDQVEDIRNSGHAPSHPRESAIIAELTAGNYTAIVRGVSDSIGVALVEVYDLNSETN